MIMKFPREHFFLHMAPDYPGQLSLRMICANFGYHSPSKSGEEVENVKV
jgi:hypothetical protein